MSRSSRSMSGTRPTADPSFENRLFDSGSSLMPRLLPCSVEIAAGHMTGQSECASGVPHRHCRALPSAGANIADVWREGTCEQSARASPVPVAEVAHDSYAAP